MTYTLHEETKIKYARYIFPTFSKGNVTLLLGKTSNTLVSSIPPAVSRATVQQLRYLQPPPKKWSNVSQESDAHGPVSRCCGQKATVSAERHACHLQKHQAARQDFLSQLHGCLPFEK